MIMDVITGRKTPFKAKKDIIEMRQQFKGIEYGFQSVKEATEYLSDNT